MEIVIFDAKIRQDDQSKQFLGNAVATLYFFHGTSLKVSILFCLLFFFFFFLTYIKRITFKLNKYISLNINISNFIYFFLIENRL